MKNTKIIPEKQYQFIILGNGANGKTTYLIRLQKDKFDQSAIVTVGVDYTNLKKKFQYDDHYIKAVVWDTSGQQIYQAISANYIRTSVGAFIALSLQTYCTVQFNSFTKQTKKQLKSWIKFINTNSQNKNYVFHVIGTKLDYVEPAQRAKVQPVFRQIIKQCLQELTLQEVPTVINPQLIDFSVISAKLQVCTKAEIQNVLFKLIKTKYDADKKYGNNQKQSSIKLKKPEIKDKNKNKQSCC